MASSISLPVILRAEAASKKKLLSLSFCFRTLSAESKASSAPAKGHRARLSSFFSPGFKFIFIRSRQQGSATAPDVEPAVLFTAKGKERSPPLPRAATLSVSYEKASVQARAGSRACPSLRPPFKQEPSVYILRFKGQL
jgi:hypothetical protein